MSAERVVFLSAAPVVVDECATVFLWTDTVHPVIVVGKAASWPAHYWDVEVLECFEHVLAIAVDVRDVAVWTNPESAVDTRTEVFRELTIDLIWDDVLALFRVDGELHVLCVHCCECKCRSSQSK